MKFLPETDKRMARVRKAREQIAQITDQLTDLDTAPLPPEDIERRVDAWLAQQADGGISHNLAHEFAGPGRNCSTRLPGFDLGGKDGPQFNLANEVAKIMAVVMPDQFRAGLLRIVTEQMGDREPGPPLADRPKIKSDLEAEREKFERVEEGEIEKLEADGWLVHRRPDARPEIILEDCK